MNFTTKERYLLEDQKNQEQLCVQKYSSYAKLASDPQLKSIFQQLAQKEQEHYNTIDQLLKGQMPSMGQGGQQQSGGQQQFGQQMQMQSSQPMQFGNQQSGGSQQSGGQQTGNFINSDKDLCNDMLATEKYVSGVYDTAIFEFRDTQVRNILNHIQKEEQQHGETLFKYMESKGMYSVK
ncbi:MAG TPA: spore coat protein [Tissierellia bacterium]|jgi:spore coat protein CotF|nr:spore coat protein [Tissierellia bacterium]